jgi:ribosomal-protein-alanine N-acetyltransferase
MAVSRFPTEPGLAGIEPPRNRGRWKENTMIDPARPYADLPRLETPRLILRQLGPADLPDVYAYASDTQVTRFLRWGPHASPAETEAYLADVLREYRAGDDGPWGIEYKATGNVVGSIHLFDIVPQHCKAEIGFVLSRSHWGQGLMPEALRCVLEVAFEQLALNRVEAYCIVENRAGRRVLEKVGMQREGTLRAFLFQKGAYRDFDVYALLQSDWHVS